jgi:hypothetical protein
MNKFQNEARKFLFKRVFKSYQLPKLMKPFLLSPLKLFTQRIRVGGQNQNLSYLENLNSILQKSLDKKEDIPYDKFIHALAVMDSVENNEVRIDTEKLILEVIRNKTFLNQIYHEKFSQMLIYVSRVKSISENDMDLLYKLYINLSKQQNGFTSKQIFLILDAFYYFENNNIPYPKQFKNDVINYCLSNWGVNFNFNERLELLRSVLYMKDEDSIPFAEKFIHYLPKIIGENSKLTLDQKLDLLQLFPKILSTIPNPEIIEKEGFKLYEFLLKNIYNECEADPEKLLCIVSNYMVYIIHQKENLFESMVPFFYRHLSSLRHEFTIELLFMALQCNFENFKNKEQMIKFTSQVYQEIKNLRTTERQFEDEMKEIMWLKSVRNKLRTAFESWKVKNDKSQENQDEHYYLKFISEIIKKSCDLFPFASKEYQDEGFDHIYSNFKNIMKFN